MRALPLVVSATACAAGLASTRALRAQELGAAAPQACTREFRTIALPVRDARGRPLGALRVRVRRARTGQLVHRGVETAAPLGDAPARDREIPPGSVPRGPARPHPYEEQHEVPGAPGTPAGVPRRAPPPAPADPPSTVPAPAQPGSPASASSSRIRVVDDGMLSRLHAAGDTLVIEVRGARAVGRGRVVVAAGRGGCHVVLVRGPAAIVLR